MFISKCFPQLSSYQNGRTPLEIAAIQGWQESVDVLFPVTTPSVQVTDSSIGEIIQHAKHMSSKPDVCTEYLLIL